MKYFIIYATAKTNVEARKIAGVLLNKKLVACVNIISKIESMYWWKGKIQRHGEAVLIAKTDKAHVKKAIKTAKAIHSYDVPDVVALPIADGNNDYFKWISEVLK